MTKKKDNKTAPSATISDNNIKKSETVEITVKTHKDANGGHPHGILDTIGDKHVSVGFTSDKKKGKNHGNIPLEIDPLDSKKEKSFMRREGTVDKIKNYHSPRKGQMTVKDYEKAKKIANKAKEKHNRRETEKAKKKK